MSRARLCCLLSVLLLCGCDAQQKLDEVEKHLVSWSSTLELTSHHYDDGGVTRKYVRQIVKAAREELDDQQQTLAETPPDNPKHRELEGRLKQVRAQVDALSHRAERAS